MKPLHVVSLSGGKDSTAMLLMMLEKDMQVDVVINADTGMEFPGMYEHLQRVEEYTDIPITYIRSEKTFEYYMYDHVRTKGKYIGRAGYGWARPNARWCTGYLKTKLIDKYFKEVSKDHEIIHYIGIAADEHKRIKDKRYPLYDWGVTEKEALQYCYDHGFNWDGLYEIFNRVSCWCCPLQSLSELRKLRHEFPDLWQQLRAMDAQSWNSFRVDYSVEQLELRFAGEDAQLRMAI